MLILPDALIEIFRKDKGVVVEYGIMIPILHLNFKEI